MGISCSSSRLDSFTSELLETSRESQPDLDRLSTIIDEYTSTHDYCSRTKHGLQRLLQIALNIACMSPRTNTDVDTQITMLLINKGFEHGLAKREGLMSLTEGFECVGCALQSLVRVDKLHVLTHLASTEPPLLRKGDVLRLHLIHRLDWTRDSCINTLRFLLGLAPSAIKYKNRFGYLLIQNKELTNSFKPRYRNDICMQMFRFLIEKGLEQHVEDKAGLLTKSFSGGCPLQNLMATANEEFLDFLVQSDPPLLCHEDIEAEKLMNLAIIGRKKRTRTTLLNSMDAGPNIAAFKCLLNFHPDGISADTIMIMANADGLWFPQVSRVSRQNIIECLFLLIEYGLERNFGGEFSMGGLMKLLVSTARKGGLILHPLLPQLMDRLVESKVLQKFNVPVFQAAIIHGISLDNFFEYSDIFICTEDNNGRLPLHLALEKGLNWEGSKDQKISHSIGEEGEEGNRTTNEVETLHSGNFWCSKIGIRDLANAYPAALLETGTSYGLYPFLLAAASINGDASSKGTKEARCEKDAEQTSCRDEGSCSKDLDYANSVGTISSEDGESSEVSNEAPSFGKEADLDTCFELLRRSPGLIYSALTTRVRNRRSSSIPDHNKNPVCIARLQGRLGVQIF